jgi:hypothetical protein
MLLCEHCYNIKTTTDNIIDIDCADEYYYKDRLRIENIVEGIYDKGFDDGYWQSIHDDYGI